MGAHQGLSPGGPPGPTRVFYDGACGLCRGAVRFAARRDRARRLRFAPLGGPAFIAALPPERRAGLPEGLVVLRPDGILRVGAGAVLHLLGCLDGPWPRVGALLGRLPRPLLEAAYGWVARHRRRRGACALAPPGDDRFAP